MFDHVYMLINLTYPTLSSEYAVIWRMFSHDSMHFCEKQPAIR